MYAGISTNIVSPKNEWELFLQIIEYGFKNIELYNSTTPIRTQDIPTLKEYTSKGFNFSIHTATNELFEGSNPINLADYYKFKSEIFTAGEIGAKLLIFHLPRKIKLTKELAKEMLGLSQSAKSKGVQLVLENNSKESFDDFDGLLDFLNDAELKYCLDLGHLNVETKGDIERQKEIISLLGTRIVQSHLHSNNGLSDQHKSLAKRQLALVDLLPKGTRLIAESPKLSNALKSVKLIEDYFSK